MKKTFLLMLALIGFGHTFCSADTIIITLYKSNCSNDDHVKHIPTERSMQVVPSVMYEDDTNVVAVTSSRLIENAHIIITDNNGMIVANKVTSLSPTAIRIQIPDADEGGMYKIEIAYGDTYLYGFFY